MKYEIDMPVIIINSPIDNQLFGTNAPTFDIGISGANVDAIWNTIDGGLTNYIFIGMSGEKFLSQIIYKFFVKIV